MKIIFIPLGVLLSLQTFCQSIEEILVQSYWGEVNEQAKSYRGKAGLIWLRFKNDNTFISYETTCTGDNVLQKGKWKIKDDIIIFSKIKTEKFKNNSIRNGKILSRKNSGKIKYRIKELKDDSLIMENQENSIVLFFKTTGIDHSLALKNYKLYPEYFIRN